MALFYPENQKRLTNISVVKLKKHGYRFELACYPNKVKSWRDKIETDLDQVLQARVIFQNVHKGEFASKKELSVAFADSSEEDILKFILCNGEIQTTELERQAEIQALFKDVAKIIADKCVNPDNNRQYTISMVERMMQECHVNLRSNRTAKQQALSVIKQLRANENLKISPASVDIKLTIDKRCLNQVINGILQNLSHLTREDESDAMLYEMTAIIEPENYHTLIKYLNSHIKGRYALEILGNTRMLVSQMTKPRLRQIPEN
ncbi:hypothetical protein Ciccas_012549 [Cichlidogyrus casuarinus]|uniref:Ribosome maturation protein SBDS n=1 Tax=Cichlidogyrus casuarinus TaxID=1844966 RepID=A0ABD2PNK4_9PLAT